MPRHGNQSRAISRQKADQRNDDEAARDFYIRMYQECNQGSARQKPLAPKLSWQSKGQVGIFSFTDNNSFSSSKFGIVNSEFAMFTFQSCAVYRASSVWST